MTKNPLALVGGALIMLVGAGFFLFFAYHLFVEEHVFRRSAHAATATIVQKETELTRADAFADPGAEEPAERDDEATAETTSVDSADVSTDVTGTAGDIIRTRYLLHYSFRPEGASEPVTGVYEATERQYGVVEERSEIELLYTPDAPHDNHRLMVPIEFGGSFWAGVSVLLLGCLFIAYLGWCFIFPEEEYEEVQSAAERKREKRRRSLK